MSVPTVYRYTDSGAPVLTGEYGKLYDLLKACLVDGYGVKDPAGWTEVFSGTNKGVLRNSPLTGTGTYLRILDDGSGADTDARVCYFEGYDTMSDVDNGTDKFPTAYTIRAYKSTQANTSPIPWYVVATERGFYLYINQLFNTQSVTDYEWGTFYFFGDYVRIRPTDSDNFFMWGSNITTPVASFSTTSVHTSGYEAERGPTGNSPSERILGSIKKGVDGVTPGATFCPCVIGTNYASARTLGSNSYPSYPNAFGGIDLSPVWVGDASSSIIRGKVPGLLEPQNDLVDNPDWIANQLDANFTTNLNSLTGLDISAQYIAASYRWNTVSSNGYRIGLLIDLSSDWYAEET